MSSVHSPVAIPTSCTTAVDGGPGFFPISLQVQVISSRRQLEPAFTPQALSIEAGLSTGSRPLCEACP